MSNAEWASVGPDEDSWVLSCMKEKENTKFCKLQSYVQFISVNSLSDTKRLSFCKVVFMLRSTD